MANPIKRSRSQSPNGDADENGECDYFLLEKESDNFIKHKVFVNVAENVNSSQNTL